MTTLHTTRVCAECGTSKPLEEFRPKYGNSSSEICVTCSTPQLLGPVTQNNTRQPTKDQLDRIRELSAVVLGDRETLFTAVGAPHSAAEASTMLGALHKVRHQMKPLAGGESELVKTIHGLKNTPYQAPPTPPVPQEETPVTTTAPTNKTCTKCGLRKPLEEMGRNKNSKDGYASWCKQCFRDAAKRPHPSKPDQTSARNAEKVRSSVGTTSAAAPAPPELKPAKSEPDPPLSVDEAWRQNFANPTLDQLTALQAFLGEASLDETARITRLITADLSARNQEPTQ